MFTAFIFKHAKEKANDASAKHAEVGGYVCKRSEQEEFGSLAIRSARSTIELKYEKMGGCEFRAEKRPVSMCVF